MTVIIKYFLFSFILIQFSIDLGRKLYSHICKLFKTILFHLFLVVVEFYQLLAFLLLVTTFSLQLKYCLGHKKNFSWKKTAFSASLMEFLLVFLLQEYKQFLKSNINCWASCKKTTKSMEFILKIKNFLLSKHRIY